MKITINEAPAPVRKIAALVGYRENGAYFRDGDGFVYIGNDGYVSKSKANTLEELLKQEYKRKPVYEGDSLTITF